MAPSRRRGKTRPRVSVISRGPWRAGGSPSSLLQPPTAVGASGSGPGGVGVRWGAESFLELPESRSAHARLSCAAELINNGVRTAWLVLCAVH